MCLINIITLHSEREDCNSGELDSEPFDSLSRMESVAHLEQA